MKISGGTILAMMPVLMMNVDVKKFTEMSLTDAASTASSLRTAPAVTTADEAASARSLNR